MVWTIDLSRGKKLQIITQLMTIKGSIIKQRLDATKHFPINSSMKYETVIEWVRKLADKAWWDSDYNGVHKKHTSLFYKVKSNCNWAHHTDNDPNHKYVVTDSNQQQLVNDLNQLLTYLGVLERVDDATDTLSSALQRMHV